MFYQVSVPGNNVYVLFNFFKKYILFVFKFLIKSAYQETMLMFYLIF